MLRAPPRKYGIHPKLPELQPRPRPVPVGEDAIWQHRATLHEGSVLYYKQWNFWIRAGMHADLRADVLDDGHGRLYNVET